MDMSVTGAEYVQWDVSSDVVLDERVEVAWLPPRADPDADTQWFDAEWVDPDSTLTEDRQLRQLVAGPAAPTLNTDAVRLAKGTYRSWLRFNTSPEYIVRDTNVALTIK